MKHPSQIYRITSFALLLSTFCSSALGAYTQSVTWSDMSSLDLGKVLKSEYASPSNLMEPSIPDSATELVLRDADAHISKEFHVPPEMKDAVTFWLKIYTEYTTQHLVIFDSRHPNLVYEVLDFRDLYKTSRNTMAYEIVRKIRIQKKIAAYRQAFASLAKNPHPIRPTPEESSILREMTHLPHKHTFAELRHSLKFQAGQRDNIAKGLVAAEAFFPKMERIFMDMGIPVELTRLSLVESSFDLSAKSRAGAAGVWQFLRPSGKEFLLIDDQRQIDERLSPLKATVAAGKLLQRNYSILHDWSLSVTSYNHGIRGLPHGHGPLDRARLMKVFDPCAKHGRLGYASINYYAEFLAVLHAEEYRKLYYGDAPLLADHVTFTKFEQTAKPEFATTIAKNEGLTLQDFRLLNPDIRNIHRPVPVGFWIAVPSKGDDLAGLSRHVRPKVIRRSTSSIPGESKTKS